MNATQPSLDGRRFDGIVLERGKTAGDADTLLFAGGRFRSSACDPYGYGDGPYTADSSGDGIIFEAQTQNANGSRLLWRGVVRGARLDGTLTMLRNGNPVGEKWVLAGEC
jgi:hypothetical protein